ncbi:MAG: lipocalin-like domain-containing protein [Verrucomicrobia bacterium]|nr:lipocalin-like domain-containing protein [Verrucomicrobiota bacterium]
MAKDLVGTWTLVSLTLEKDGAKADLYRPNPRGLFIHDANNHVVLVITGADLSKFAANDRAAGTTEENKAVVQGSLGYFGTETVDEAGKIITIHIEECIFPNWIGTDRKLSFTLNGDEFDQRTLSSTTGTGTAHIFWKRVTTQ